MGFFRGLMDVVSLGSTRSARKQLRFQEDQAYLQEQKAQKIAKRQEVERVKAKREISRGRVRAARRRVRGGMFGDVQPGNQYTVGASLGG